VIKDFLDSFTGLDVSSDKFIKCLLSERLALWRFFPAMSLINRMKRVVSMTEHSENPGLIQNEQLLVTRKRTVGCLLSFMKNRSVPAIKARRKSTVLVATRLMRNGGAEKLHSNPASYRAYL